MSDADDFPAAHDEAIERVFRAIVALVLLAGTAACSYPLWMQHRKLTTFVPCEGRVIASGVAPHTTEDDNGVERTKWEPWADYTYEAGGRRRSSNIRPDVPWGGPDRTSDEATARRVAARYERGAVVTVYHDPLDPDDAYLERHSRLFPFGLLLLSTAWVPWYLAWPVLLPATRRIAANGEGARPARELPLDPGRKLARLSVGAAVATLVGAGVLSTYAVAAGPEVDSGVWGLGAAYAFASTLLYLPLLASIPAAATLGPGVFRLVHPSAAVGETVRLSLDQAVRRGRSIRSVRLRVVALAGIGEDQRQVGESAETIGRDRLRVVDGRLRVSAVVAVPAPKLNKSEMKSGRPEVAWRAECRVPVWWWGEGESIDLDVPPRDHSVV